MYQTHIDSVAGFIVIGEFFEFCKMSRNMYISTFVACCLFNSLYASFVPFIKPCQKNDNDCLLATNLQIALPYLADGIQEIGAPATDPMVFENITMDQGYFKFVLPTLKVSGGKKCKLAEFKQDYQESTMKLTIDCPMLGTGSYKFTGKICIFNVDKEGDFLMQTDSMKTVVVAKYDKSVVNGKNYYNLLSYEYTAEPSESMHIELSDLFSGDVGKALPYLTAVNEDLDTVLKVGAPISNGIVENFYGALKKFFANVPIDELVYA